MQAQSDHKGMQNPNTGGLLIILTMTIGPHYDKGGEDKTTYHPLLGMKGLINLSTVDIKIFHNT